MEARGTFDASGNLTVGIQVPLGPSREVKQIAVSTNIATGSETNCSTYIGTNASGVLISQTYTGNSDTDSQPNVLLRSGDSICAVWSGGVSGALGTLTIIYDEVAQ